MMISIVFFLPLLSCIIAMPMSDSTASPSPNKPTATFEDVKAAKDNKSVLLIDVREASELEETGSIPGSINIPLGQLESVLKNMSSDEFKNIYGREKPIKEFPIIFSCRSGRRSGLAQDIALQLGYKNVRNYAGGWLDWEEKTKN